MSDRYETATVTRRGNWIRIFVPRAPEEDHGLFLYYYRGFRVPWILWALFS